MSRNESKQLGNGANAVITAAYSGDLETVIAELDQGIDANARDCDGDTALMLAAERGHVEVVKVLLERGTDVNERNLNGETALLRAAGNGRAAVVRVLLAHQAECNAGDIVNCTPLMRAAYRGHVDVVKELLGCGADANARNKFGNNSAMLAARNGHSEIEGLLRAALDGAGQPRTPRRAPLARLAREIGEFRDRMRGPGHARGLAVDIVNAERHPSSSRRRHRRKAPPCGNYGGSLQEPCLRTRAGGDRRRTVRSHETIGGYPPGVRRSSPPALSAAYL